ncbi:hypothetical protein [Corallococcus aberystwythensis]|uniref:Uncharacterized protein n=1 Tax=Corallococcus aberystwythensis TaxID=2316722 RepID=A0A3A8P263_9BACT|nr:hypothetical protein [Corallococcus aberystwythensis]RKH50597.1 hypothetical protein D7W81_41030 [Corallococcus aberystwythensis]
MFDACGGCERRGTAGEVFDGRESGELPEPPPAEREPLPEDFGGRCCTHARAVACSCAFHWVCVRHGDLHVGTHD